MVDSISKRNLTDEKKEEEREKVRKVREKWHKKSTANMTLEERVQRLEIIVAGEE